MSSFLLVSYLHSLAENAALAGIPFLGFYVLVTMGGITATVVVAAALLLGGLVVAGLSSLEQILATHVDHDRLIRRG